MTFNFYFRSADLVITPNEGNISNQSNGVYCLQKLTNTNAEDVELDWRQSVPPDFNITWLCPQIYLWLIAVMWSRVQSLRFLGRETNFLLISYLTNSSLVMVEFLSDEWIPCQTPHLTCQLVLITYLASTSNSQFQWDNCFQPNQLWRPK